MQTFEEFSTECGAYAQRYQQAIDTLYELGCKYDMTQADMGRLCDLTDVSYRQLMNHSIGKPAPVTLAN